jgi:hypothetical protein
VHAADLQDRDGGVLLMSTLFGLFPFLLKLYADSGYQGPKFQRALRRVCRIFSSSDGEPEAPWCAAGVDGASLSQARPPP